MEQPRECKHLGNPTMEKFRGDMHTNGIFQVPPKGQQVYTLIQHKQEREFKIHKERDGRGKTKNTAIQYSSNLWQSSCKNIQHLISQRYWWQEKRQQNNCQNVGETYTVRGTWACITFWKNAETQIDHSIMHMQDNWMNNIQPMYAQWLHRVWTTFEGIVQQTFRFQLQ